MTQETELRSYTVETDEKEAAVLVYTPGHLFRGDLVVKKLIRVSTWLRTNAAPDRITIYNVKSLITSAGSAYKLASFREMHISTNQIEAFHLLPPASEPLDYDPTEPNRRMLPVTVLLGGFRIDGSIRISTQSNLTTFLDIARENFISLYDSCVSNTQNTSVGTLKVPYLIVRQESCVFALP